MKTNMLFTSDIICIYSVSHIYFFSADEENDASLVGNPMRHPAGAPVAVGPGGPPPLQPQNGNVFGNGMAPIEASGPDVTGVTGPGGGPGGPNGAASQICAGCGVRIADRYFLQSCDRLWHTACLKCACCRVNLCEVGSSCYTRSGMILCKADYLKWVLLELETMKRWRSWWWSGRERLGNIFVN